MNREFERELIKGKKAAIVVDLLEQVTKQLGFASGNKKQNEDLTKWYINTDYGRCEVDYVRSASFTPNSSLVRYKHAKGEDYLVVPERCLGKLPPQSLWGNEDNPIFQSVK